MNENLNDHRHPVETQEDRPSESVKREESTGDGSTVKKGDQYEEDRSCLATFPMLGMCEHNS